MDRLISMTVFARAAELGSFSAAAEALQMSSQLVGKHVQTLEQHLGARLLNRTTRRQRLTEVGAAYYDRVKLILAEVDSAEGLVAEAHRKPQGRLRISAPVTFGNYALSRKLPDYLLAYPDVSLELSLSNRYVDLLSEGFDAVFRIGELTDSGLVARPLAPYRMKLCAAPSYLAEAAPINVPQDLAFHICLGFQHPELGSHWTFCGHQGVMSVPISGRLTVDSGEALMAAARAGMGLLLQPAELVEDDIAAGRLVEVLRDFPAPSRPLHILFAPDRRMTPKLRSFLDFFVKMFGSTERKL
ncbi:LysR family transcriptional regulator [Paraburkholderia flagellata]|uniref:LysR family transcriptional regulator n=1 Tax=Paraburkholderia flagellata TaxID=2883241 RepID=UPI001F44A362|nr:LysR family transcriptional regulator [Paraburkholderia flagellata]